MSFYSDFLEAANSPADCFLKLLTKSDFLSNLRKASASFIEMLLLGWIWFLWNEVELVSVQTCRFIASFKKQSIRQLTTF